MPRDSKAHSMVVFYRIYKDENHDIEEGETRIEC